MRDEMPLTDFLPGDPWIVLSRDPAGRQYYPALTQFIREHAITSVVEIGVRCGYSMAAMLRGNPDLIYLGIDDDRGGWGGMPGGLTHAQRLYRRYSTRPDAQVFLRMRSQDLTCLPHRFDLAYIDGDHDEAACYHDLELCLDWCDWLVVDDYGFLPSVSDAVARFATTYQLPVAYLPVYRGWAVMETRRLGEATTTQIFRQGTYHATGGAMTYVYTGSTPTYHPKLGMLVPGDNVVPPEHMALADTLPYLRRVEATALAAEDDDPHHVDDPDADAHEDEDQA
jgi:hypothetical protein